MATLSELEQRVDVLTTRVNALASSTQLTTIRNLIQSWYDDVHAKVTANADKLVNLEGRVNNLEGRVTTLEP